MIRAISSAKELRLVTKLLRASFGTVAEEFHVTEQIWPRHPAYITEERVKELVAEGLRFYGFFQKSELIGVIGTKKQDSEKYTIEKLAVLPECRHHGIGKKLIDFACKKIREEGGKIACIGIIDKHTVLKEWYLAQSFELVEIKDFEGFPFTVGFMEKSL